MMTNNQNITPKDLESLKCVITGAAPIGPYDLQQFENKANGKTFILQAYGMTEASPLVLSQTELIENCRTLGSAGVSIPNTQVKIVEIGGSDQRGLEPNQSGELLIKGPQVMKGYYKNEEATRETITEDGWLRTGDIAHYDEEEQFYITDRLKELIKVKGYQVAPAELEALLRTCPGVEEAAVIGVADKKHGEVPKAFVVFKKNSRISTAEVQNYVAQKAAAYKHLQGGVVQIDSIPKTASGKILRRQLRMI